MTLGQGAWSQNSGMTFTPVLFCWNFTTLLLMNSGNQMVLTKNDTFFEVRCFNYFFPRFYVSIVYFYLCR